MKTYLTRSFWTLVALFFWILLATTFVAVMLGHNGTAGRGAIIEFAASAFHLAVALGVYWPLCKIAWRRAGKATQALSTKE